MPPARIRATPMPTAMIKNSRLENYSANIQSTRANAKRPGWVRARPAGAPAETGAEGRSGPGTAARPLPRQDSVSTNSTTAALSIIKGLAKSTLVEFRCFRRLLFVRLIAPGRIVLGRNLKKLALLFCRRLFLGHDLFVCWLVEQLAGHAKIELLVGTRAARAGHQNRHGQADGKKGHAYPAGQLG